MTKYFLTSLLAIQFGICYGQTKIYYHECVRTELGEFIITKLNISPDSLPAIYAKETADEKGRVVELKYYNNWALDTDGECGFFPWLQYQYPDDTTIFEYHLLGVAEPGEFYTCGPVKLIYSLSKNQKNILREYTELIIDTTWYLKNGWTIDSVKKIGKEVQEERAWSIPFIDGYLNSISKLNGIFPIRQDFNIEDFHYYDSELQKEEIIKALSRK